MERSNSVFAFAIKADVKRGFLSGLPFESVAIFIYKLKEIVGDLAQAQNKTAETVEELA